MVLTALQRSKPENACHGQTQQLRTAMKMLSGGKNRSKLGLLKNAKKYLLYLKRTS